MAIGKKELERLAKLARIELYPSEEAKLLADLSKILGHFNELQELDTSRAAPLTGGTDLKNVLREDGARENTGRGDGADVFPEEETGFLKIPPVFE